MLAHCPIDDICLPVFENIYILIIVLLFIYLCIFIVYFLKFVCVCGGSHWKQVYYCVL